MTPEVPDLDHFDHDDAWRVGRSLVEHCRDRGFAVTIDIKIGAQRVFHAALPGTSADNDSWADRKGRVVSHFGLSSLEVYERHARDNPDFSTLFALPLSDYAPAGGAVPVRVRGTAVGVLAVSGLASEEDHGLAVAALRAEKDRQAGATTEVS